MAVDFNSKILSALSPVAGTDASTTRQALTAEPEGGTMYALRVTASRLEEQNDEMIVMLTQIRDSLWRLAGG